MIYQRLSCLTIRSSTRARTSGTRAGSRYPWLDDVTLLNRSYLIGDYRQACGDGAVEKLVLLQAEVDSAAAA